MAPQLEALAKSNETLRLRKIDIGSWDSEVAQRYGIRSLPSVWIYDGKKLISSDRKDSLALLKPLGL